MFEISAKFIVSNEDNNILLKQIKKELLRENALLIEKIYMGEAQIKKDEVVKADVSMGDKEIDGLLMH
ncbi:MAG: hypothetical protein Q8O89_01505 [Nanoarchaeota archaeon]|nr:hypothetical protein [Nanoarchaeota archaeon]